MCVGWSYELDHISDYDADTNYHMLSDKIEQRWKRKERYSVRDEA